MLRCYICLLCGFRCKKQAYFVMNGIQKCFWGLLWGSFWVQGWAQEGFVRNDVEDKRPTGYAFINARIYVDPQTYLERASLLMVEGKVAAVGADIKIPPNTPTIDLKERWVFPSFIDMYGADFGIEGAGPGIPSGYYKVPEGAQLSPKREGLYGSNDAIKAEFCAKDALKEDPAAARRLREVGFGAVVAFREDGIARGTSTLLSLSEGPLQERVLLAEASAHFSFDPGSSKQDYPRSPMGAAALLRQMRWDAEWYASPANKKQSNISLAALHSTRHLPQIIEAPHIHFAFLAHNIGKETGVNYIIKGAGDAYQHAEALARRKVVLILPLAYPDAYEVEDPHQALDVSLSDMKHWEMAPANAALLHKAGVSVALTAHGLKDISDFWPQLREAMRHGFSKTAALAALTTQPAQLLKVDKQVGTLKVGSWANFFIASGDVFEDEEAIIYEHWIQGQAHILKDMQAPDYSGEYSLSVGTDSYELSISGPRYAPQISIQASPGDVRSYTAQLQSHNHRIQLHFFPKERPRACTRLTGWRTGTHLRGRGQDSTGLWVDWMAQYKAPPSKETQKEEKTALPSPTIGKMYYPFAAYGYDTLPQARTYLIQNATVWTNEAEGRLSNTDVWVENGKISALGQALAPPPEAVIIDGKDRHLTSGIIDEHAHIALFAVNEWAHAVSAEVRMKDVINPRDINIYRQLAGGVTAVQLLHGSANPIGGQSALIKLRWGQPAEGLLIKDADPFIKFALGENVKRSNAPSAWNKRYPQTRMGVEQVIWDAFLRAKQYGEAWARYKKPPRGKKQGPRPRRDLQMEAIWEILEQKRFITCHSYVQSEVAMLMSLAARFRVRVNTFTHILEGYKIADKMFRHGAAASTFSDWWAYKYEVREAIPYNAAVMHKAGLVVAINSDDAEMGRRLNQEAAKTITYGGLSEEEAWKTVTLNPARMLHLEDRMGSIKVGKDADLVLWSENPLSIYAKAEKTFVDGALYYDRSQEEVRKKALEAERARLIQKMLKAKSEGKGTQKATQAQSSSYSCRTHTLSQE